LFNAELTPVAVITGDDLTESALEPVNVTLPDPAAGTVCRRGRDSGQGRSGGEETTAFHRVLRRWCGGGRRGTAPRHEA